MINYFVTFGQKYGLIFNQAKSLGFIFVSVIDLILHFVI